MVSGFYQPQLTERFLALVGFDLLIAALFQCAGLGIAGLSEEGGFLYLLVFGSILFTPMIVFFDILVLAVTIVPMVLVWGRFMQYLGRRGYAARSAAMIAAPVLAAFHTVVSYFAVGWMMGEWSSIAWDKLNLLGLIGAVPAILVSPLVAARVFRNEVKVVQP